MITRFTLFLALMLLTLKCYAVSFKVSDIRLEGLQRVSASPVFAALSVQAGDTIDSEDIRQNVQSLFETGFFSNIQMAKDGSVLIIILQERPAIKSIEIDGNKAIKTEQLMEVLGDNDIREGEILQRHLLQGITNELERTYIAQARYGASVKADVKELPNNLVSISINVDEGKSAKIRHINFVGNTIFSDDVLLDLFELTRAKWTTIFSSNDQYSKEKLTGDIENLESFYLDQGYLDFSVVSSQVSLSPDKRSVYITMNLNEGDIYKVNKVDIAGDPVLPERSVRQLLLMRKGDRFSQSRLDGTSEYMTTLLGNAGYTNASVEGIIEKNTEDKTVDLTFFIDPSKRVYVRRIEFSGNTKTSDEVMRREMRQIEGSSASNARIEQSKVRLERLSFFKEVNVETKDVPGSDDLVDIEYTVEEQPSGSINASVGYAEFSGVNLGVSVQQNNWLGTGKQVGFSISDNIFSTNYNFSYNDPYFTPDGVSRGFSAYYQKRDTERLRLIRFNTNTFGGGIRFGYPISEVSRLNFGLGLENQDITVGALPAQEIRQSPFLLPDVSPIYVLQSDIERVIQDPSINLTRDDYLLPTFDLENRFLRDSEPGFLDKFGTNFNSATMDLSWSRFTLNRGILATRGTSQTLRLETTVPGSDLEYYKIHYDAQAFKPISRNFTLRFKTTLGYGDGYGELDELPFFENFYAGGFGSVRGFERSTLGPKSTFSENYAIRHFGQKDINNDGTISRSERFDKAYVLCDQPSRRCEPNKLTTTGPQGNVDSRNNAFGGNILVEFSTELILPIPFVEDSRSMQLVAFVDAGNVFSTSCREGQLNCFDLDPKELSSSIGIGFTWISGFGPMTFSSSKPLHKSDFDERKAFDFTFGAGF